MKFRRVLAIALLAPSLMGTEFRGCGSRDAPDAASPLPVSEVCFADADCVSDDACVAVTCISGVCVSGGPTIDADGDGFAPSPCGEDCNDTEARTFPGSAERCDGVDQDCDGSLDEGATGASASGLNDGLTDTRISGLGDGFAVVGRSASGAPGLFGYQVDASGRMRAPAAILVSDATDDFAAIGAEDSLLLAVTRGADPPQLVELGGAGGTFTVRTAADIGTVGDATQITLTQLGAEVFVLYDVADGTRFLARRSALGAPTPIDAGISEPERPHLATTGDALVATASGQRLIFYSVDGTERSQHMLTGTLADQPIASGDGFVYAAFRDAFDHVLTRVTQASIASPGTAPSGDRNDRVAIHRAPPNVLVTRIGSLGLRAWVLEPDLRTFVTTFDAEMIAPDGTPEAVSATTNARGLSAILSSYNGRSTIAVLSCEGG